MGSGVGLQDSNPQPLMSALGQKQTSDWRLLMSALPPMADIAERNQRVGFVPIPDITGHYSISRQRVEEHRGRCCSRSGYCRVVLVYEHLWCRN